MNLVSVIVGVVALALAIWAPYSGPAVGVAMLGIVLGYIQFRRSTRKTGLIAAGMALAVAAVVIGVWSASKREGTTPSISDVTERLLNLNHAYFVHHEDENTGWFSAEIENISGKTITAFEARITLLADDGAPLHQEALECLDQQMPQPLPPNQRLFVFVVYHNFRMQERDNPYLEFSHEALINRAFGLDDTPPDLLDARVAGIRAQFDTARHAGKTDFVCTFISFEEDDAANSSRPDVK